MRGVDVSHHQGVVDWYAVHASGISFAVLKATEGTSYVDPMFSTNRSQAHRVGLTVGCYHFARPSRNPAIKEADHFLGVVGDGDELLVLDFEDDDVTGSKADWALTWLERVEQRSGRLPFLYSYVPYWKAHGSPDPAFARFPFWMAAYRSTPPPPPLPWKDWAIWQFSSSGTVAGIQGRVDLNEAKWLGDDMYSDADRARDNKVAQQVQEIHDAIYKGHPEFGQPGMEGNLNDIRKKLLG